MVEASRAAYGYFCKHESAAASHYANCSTCVAQPICCDTSKARSTTELYSGGSRCAVEGYGVTDVSKCGDVEVPPACSANGFSDHAAGAGLHQKATGALRNASAVILRFDTFDLEPDAGDFVQVPDMDAGCWMMGGWMMDGG